MDSKDIILSKNANFLWRSGKEYGCQCKRCKRHSLIPGWGRLPGGRNGNPLQYSCLENPMDRGAWRARIHGVAESETSTNTHTNVKGYIVYDSIYTHSPYDKTTDMKN